MSMSAEDVYMWLMDGHNSTYLRWIVIWLSGAFTISNILVQVSSPNNNYELLPLSVIWIIYLGILGGMSFVIYRLTNIVEKHMRWYHAILKLRPDLPFCELYRDRGCLQNFFVDNDGKIRERNRCSFIILQDAFFFILFGTISSPVKEFLVPAIKSIDFSWLSIWIWPFITSILMILFIDYIRKPKILIKIIEEPVSASPQRYVHVSINNRPLNLIARSTATGCRGKVSYRNIETGDHKGPHETKWASRPSPVHPTLDNKNQPILLSDETLIGQAKTENIPPGVERLLDIAMKIEGEANAYVWTPESYFDMRKEEYELCEGEYEVEVVIECPGISPVRKKIRLINRGTSTAGLQIQALES